MGDYLSFVDGDDVLPSYALEALVGTLEHTGSDDVRVRPGALPVVSGALSVRADQFAEVVTIA